MMNFFSQLLLAVFGKNRLGKGASFATPTGTQTASGNVVNAETALKLSVVWACVRLRSQTIASLPLHLYGADKRLADNHPLYRIIHDSPNADMTASEFWEAMVASLDLWGNAYAYIVKSGDKSTGQVISLEVLDPEMMKVTRAKDGAVTYHYRENNQSFDYSDDEIFHIKGFTIDGLVGLSPIAYQAQVMGQQVDANLAANFEFKNNLKTGGFLKTGEKVLTDEQRHRLRQNLSDFSKAENAGKFMVLEAGMDVVSGAGIRLNPQDAQLLESRYFGIEEICRTFATPPQLVYHTNKASSWASSLEGMNLGYLTYSLRPILVRIEQAIIKKLLTPAERKAYKPRFSVEGLLRADTAGRASFYAQMLQNGVMSRNEVRELEDLPPVAGADSLTVQLNLTPIDRLNEVQAKAQTQT